METLRITLFGHICITCSSDSKPLKLPPSSESLLAYLLLQPRPVSREVLVDVFWMESPPERARGNLASAIWRLRQALEPDNVRSGTYLIVRNTGEVGFNWECQHWLDTAIFEQSVFQLLRRAVTELSVEDASRIESALPLYRGDLLEGMYDDWALRERERFRSIYLGCLDHLMDFYSFTGNAKQSIAYGQEIVRCDPCCETTHRALMRLYWKNGQRTLAVRQYAQCREFLERELGIRPLPETEALYEEIVLTTPSDEVGDDRTLGVHIAQLVSVLNQMKQSHHELVRALDRVSESVSFLVEHKDNLRANGDMERRDTHLGYK